MKAVHFPEVNVELAKDQEEYHTLPCCSDPFEKSTTVCFELTDAEFEKLAKTRRIWFKILTPVENFPPIMPTVNKSQAVPKYRNVTVVFGPAASGKSNLLAQIKRTAKCLQISESEINNPILAPNDIEYLLIDDAVGVIGLKDFVDRMCSDYNIVIATQSQTVVDLFEDCKVLDMAAIADNHEKMVKAQRDKNIAAGTQPGFRGFKGNKSTNLKRR